jgi:hypothetical protein
VRTGSEEDLPVLALDHSIFLKELTLGVECAEPASASSIAKAPPSASLPSFSLSYIKRQKSGLSSSPSPALVYTSVTPPFLKQRN